jgi:multicomponent K+:H+ antiporter subunit G
VSADVAPWVEMVVALLIAASGVMSVCAAIGMLRLREFFQRLHPPALATTLGAWCTCAASIVYFSARESRPMPGPLVLVLLLAITAPITTMLLARAALFRRRQAGDDSVPPALRGGS